MTATTTTAAGRGSAWRAAVRPMPALVAASYLALLLVSVIVMVLALAAELNSASSPSGWRSPAGPAPTPSTAPTNPPRGLTHRAADQGAPTTRP